MTLSFYQHAKSQTSKVKIGPQAHHLTTLLDAGFNVPKGFLVAADTCRAFFAHGRLQDKITMLLERCNYHDPADLVRVSHTIQKLIASHEFPHEAAESLLEASVKVSNERVMLTASPLDAVTLKNEARPQRIYGVEGEANILLAIRTLWASQFGADDLYRISSAEKHDFPCMAICVQVQPRAMCSGILTTTQPQDKHTCVARVVWGEGAYLGKLQGADTYWVDKESGNEKETQRSLQTREFVWHSGELVGHTIIDTKQKKQKLGSPTLKSLAELAKDIQQKLFFPQEATFVYDGKKLYLIDVHAMTSEAKTELAPSPQTKRVLLKGIGASPGIITGMVHVVRSPQDLQSRPGEIIVARSLSHIADKLLRSAHGIIVEEETETGALMELAAKGVALLMNAAGATDLLEPGSFVTLHTPRGEVLAGGYTTHIKTPEPTSMTTVRTATRIGTSCALDTPIHLDPELLRGHVVLSPHHIIREVGIHPLELVREHKTKILAGHISHALSQVCRQFPQTPLLYSFTQFTGDEYAFLRGAQNFELPREVNPLMGYMGATRILQTPEIILAELEALVAVRTELYGKHLSVVIPRARTAYEVRRFTELLGARGLQRSASCRHFVDLSIPSLVFELESIAPLVDGVILNIDHLYAHLFAHDPACDTIRFHESDIETPLRSLISIAREQCERQGIHLILRGSLLEHDAFLSYVVQHGIAEVIIPTKQLSIVRQRLNALEQEHVTHV